MTTQSDTPHERATEEADSGVNMKLILGVGVGSLIVFAISTYVAYRLLNHEKASLIEQNGATDPTPLLGNPEIGIVDSIHFDSDHRLATWKAKLKERAESYSWVDRGKGVVAIPIAQAMQQVIDTNHHESREMKPLPWATAPTAPGTLEIAIRNLKIGQPVVAKPISGPPVSPGGPGGSGGAGAPAAAPGGPRGASGPGGAGGKP